MTEEMVRSLQQQDIEDRFEYKSFVLDVLHGKAIPNQHPYIEMHRRLVRAGIFQDSGQVDNGQLFCAFTDYGKKNASEMELEDMIPKKSENSFPKGRGVYAELL